MSVRSTFRPVAVGRSTCSTLRFKVGFKLDLRLRNRNVYYNVLVSRLYDALIWVVGSLIPSSVNIFFSCTIH